MSVALAPETRLINPSTFSLADKNVFLHQSANRGDRWKNCVRRITPWMKAPWYNSSLTLRWSGESHIQKILVSPRKIERNCDRDDVPAKIVPTVTSAPP